MTECSLPKKKCVVTPIENNVHKNTTDSFENKDDFYIDKFKKSVSDGPLFVCTSCNQSWFRENVHQANFLKCNVSLKLKCTNGTKSVNNIEWVCSTCRLHLNAGKIPECSIGNGMKFPHIPSELKGLTQLEERLISPRIPFMIIREQLRGGQFCIKGNVVNVPSDVNKTVRLLPRSINDDETILVRFKGNYHMIQMYTRRQ